MDTATPIGRAATGAVRKRSPGAGCTRPTSGSLTCGRRSSCASRSAASAPGTGGESARRMSTTSSTTRATGQSSATVATSRASVTVAIAARRREKCTKIAANQSAAALRRGGRLGRSGASRERRAGLPCRPLPGGQKVWARPLKTACPPSCEIFSPRGIFGNLLRVPRSLTGAVMNFLLPRPLDTRGAGNAQEQKTKRRSAWAEGLRLMRGVLT